MQREFTKLIKEVKLKRELSGIADSIVQDIIEKHLKKYNLQKEQYSLLSKKEKKFFIKEIRAQLRLLSGRFQIYNNKTSKILSNSKYQEILKKNLSTRERLTFYDELNSIIENLKVTSILDLGCGLNPLALANSKAVYYAIDIREDEIDIINKFFSKNKIKGRAWIGDISKINLEELPKIDLCIILKLLDILKSKTLTRSLLTKINARHFIISFSTITLSGKKMRYPVRIWFENLLSELNFSWRIIKTENETLYIINKPQLNLVLHY